MSFIKDFGREFSRIGKSLITGPDKIVRAEIPGRESWGKKAAKPNPNSPKINVGAFGGGNYYRKIDAERFVTELIDKEMAKDSDIARDVKILYPLSRYHNKRERANDIVKNVLNLPGSPFGSAVEKPQESAWIKIKEKEKSNALRSQSAGTQKWREKNFNYKIYKKLMGTDEKQ